MTKELELELIDKNWKQFVGAIDKLKNKSRRTVLKNLCEDMGNHLATCPSATKLEHTGAFAGGLIWSSNLVLENMLSLSEIYSLELTYDEMATVALFHAIGKLGVQNDPENQPTHDYYLVQSSEWHANKLGAVFEINKEIGNMPVSVLSMWWLNKYGVDLSPKEIQAILAVQNVKDMYANEIYNSEPLTMVLMQAVQATAVKNKGFVDITCTKKWQG